MIELENNTVQIIRYPEGMTGKDLRKALGISENPCIFSKKAFKLKHKFKCIKKENRLAYLLQMVKVEKEILTYKQMQTKRNAFNAHKLISLPLSEKSTCYCCSNQATLRHHVVPLAKGGRNKNNNIVPLCRSCHSKVHPHLHKKTSNEAVASRHSVSRELTGRALSSENNKINIVAVNG
jgi:5-methylcytosine-specific restriction endonuclease McrA